MASNQTLLRTLTTWSHIDVIISCLLACNGNLQVFRSVNMDMIKLGLRNLGEMGFRTTNMKHCKKRYKITHLNAK